MVHLSSRNFTKLCNKCVCDVDPALLGCGFGSTWEENQGFRSGSSPGNPELIAFIHRCLCEIRASHWERKVKSDLWCISLILCLSPPSLIYLPHF